MRWKKTCRLRGKWRFRKNGNIGKLEAKKKIEAQENM